MNILEQAEMLSEIAKHIAQKKGKSVQEVWPEAIKELELINKSKER